MPEVLRETFRTDPDACPWCGHRIDAATEAAKGFDPADGQPRAPKDGDVSICIKCCSVMVFAATPPAARLRLRRATTEEAEETMRAFPRLFEVWRLAFGTKEN